MTLLSRLKDVVFSVGFGVTLHGIANEAYYKGGYAEILSFQGEYIGLVLMIVSFLLSRKYFDNTKLID